MEFTPVLSKKNRFSTLEIKDSYLDPSLIAKYLPKLYYLKEKANLKRIKVSENKLFIKEPAFSIIKNHRHVLKFMSPKSQNKKTIDIKFKERTSLYMKCKTPTSKVSYKRLHGSPNIRENMNRINFNHEVHNTSNFTKILSPFCMPIPKVNHTSVNSRRTPDLWIDNSICSNSSNSSEELTPVFRPKF